MSMMSILPSSRFRILPLTLSAQSEQGVWYDPSDLTAEKIMWRRNLLSNSIFTAGWTIGGTPTITTGVADPYGRFEAVTIEDDDTGVNEYLLAPAITISNGITYTGSISVKKTLDTDYFVLRLNLTGGTQTDSRVCINTATGAVTATQSATNTSVVDQGDFWRVSLTVVNLGNSTVLTLLHYPSANDSGGTSITAAAIGVATVAAPQVEIGSSPTEYQRIANFNADFMTAFPDHSLFQDAAGTIPVIALGQPCGLVLDKRLGLVLGPEMAVNGDVSQGTTNWYTADSNTTVSVVSGRIRTTLTGSTSPRTSLKIDNLVVGNTYQVSLDFFKGTLSVDGILRVASTAPITTGTVAQFQTASSVIGQKIIFTATATTMYVGAVASTTGVGQYFELDNISVRELPGNHAYQTSAPSRPTLEARVNLFTESEFRNGVTDAPVRAGLLSATTLTGYLGALAFGHDGTTSTYAYKGGVITGLMYVASVVVKMDDGNAPTFGGAALNSSDNTFGIAVGGSSANPTQYSVVALGDGFYRVSTAVTTAGPSQANTGVLKYSTNNNRTFKVTAYDLRLASEAAYSYQRVNTATDYADVGAPRYLQADGVDDWMVTNSIDFTGTDKMTVWAGVRKLGGATAVQLLAELSTAATNPGVFSIFAPRSTSGTYNFLLNGNAAGSLSTDAAYPEPITNVLSCSFDISEPLLANEIRPRINGVIPTLGTLDVGPAGTGTFGNYPLYLFRRGGATLPFSGRLYGLIICGAASSMSHIVAGERWINGKTRAY